MCELTEWHEATHQRDKKRNELKKRNANETRERKVTQANLKTEEGENGES